MFFVLFIRPIYKSLGDNKLGAMGKSANEWE